MARPVVAVIGGGTAGLNFSRAIRQVLPESEAEVVVIEASERAVYRPVLTQVATGFRDPGDAEVSLSGMAKLGVKPVFSRVERIDVDNRSLELSDGSKISYDYLVVAAGAVPKEDAVPGLREANYNPWTLEGALKLREALSRGPGKLVVGAAGMPYPCPPAPFELAGLVRRRLGPGASIKMVFPAPKPLPQLGPEVSGKLEEIMKASGVEFLGGVKVEEVDSGKGRVRLEGGVELEFEVLALVPPFAPPRFLVESGIAPEGGWPTVDPFKGFRHARLDGVYVIGDTASPTLGTPMAGFIAAYMARAAAASIASEIRGEGPVKPEERVKASCYLDLIDDGAAIFCDFTDVMFGGGQPHCHIVAEGPLAGEFKLAFERYWKSRVAPPA